MISGRFLLKISTFLGDICLKTHFLVKKFGSPWNFIYICHQKLLMCPKTIDTVREYIRLYAPTYTKTLKIWGLAGLLTLLPYSISAQTINLPSLRTNALLPLMNIGAEQPLGNRWSVGADVYWPWIFRASNHKNCFQAFGAGIEGRYWLGKNRQPEQRLLGHSLGVFSMTGYYDWERNYSGYQGDFIVVGFDYLYAKPIFKGRMHLELSVGVGYFHSKATHYNVFEDGGKGYRDKDYRKIFEYFGPLKATVALVLPLQASKSKTKEKQ